MTRRLGLLWLLGRSMLTHGRFGPAALSKPLNSSAAHPAARRLARSAQESVASARLAPEAQPGIEGYIASTVSLLLSGPYSSRFGQVCTPEAEDKAEFNAYKDFHNTCRRDPACLSRALVWQCDEHDFCGGLGDEIRGLAFTMYVAMATRRPFFVRWKRMSQEMLNLFEGSGIDLHVPQLENCQRTSFMGGLSHRKMWDIAVNDGGCSVWTTNKPVNEMFSDSEFMRNKYPIMQHIPLEATIGCSMNFMFSPLAMTRHDWTNYAHLPGDFVAIHLRCVDTNMGSDATAQVRATERDNVGKALECAEGMHAANVVFVSCSESAKQEAKEVARQRGGSLKIYTAGAHARHIDHDHAALSEDAFHNALWSDFVVLQQATALIVAGRMSGFSTAAASMGLMPLEKIMKVSKEAPPCVQAKMSPHKG